MPSPIIVRSQINELVQTILKSNVLIGSLEFKPPIPKTNLHIELPIRVAYEDPSFYFDITESNDSFGAHFFPNPKLERTVSWHKSWSGVITQFQTWLTVVGTEMSQPDPWALIDEGSVLRDAIPSAGGVEQIFTDQELSRVREFLLQTRNLLLTEARPAAKQLELIDERLSYLEQSAKRQNKQDWAHTTVGVMFTIAIGLALAPDQANKLFQLTAHFLETIFVKLLA